MTDQISSVDTKIRECVSVLDSARWNLVALAEERDKLLTEIEKLKARKCSHGNYEMYGTDGCESCEAGRIEMYRLNKHCLECQRARAQKPKEIT